MRTIEWLVIATLVVSPFALAEEPHPYSGTWDVKMVNLKGESRKGKLVLGDQDGTWNVVWHNVKNPCSGRTAPVLIQRFSADELVFEINKSRSLKGCEDHVATLKRVNETTLEGELDDGRKLTLIRK